MRPTSWSFKKKIIKKLLIPVFTINEIAFKLFISMVRMYFFYIFCHYRFNFTFSIAHSRNSVPHTYEIVKEQSPSTSKVHHQRVLNFVFCLRFKFFVFVLQYIWMLANKFANFARMLSLHKQKWAAVARCTFI